jgi:speckle-type POZ protein
MATDKRSVSEIIPRKDTSLFHLRLCLSSLEDLGRTEGFGGYIDIVAAGCKCTAYLSEISDPNIALHLLARHDGAAKVCTHMVFLDKSGSPATSMGTGAAVTEGLYGLSAAWDDVKANCVVDNSFVVLCSVDIDRTPPAASSLKEDLPDLGHELAVMSINKELTDVSFDVEGVSFDAHRLVLAARSPVFKAELYGPMAEGKMASITIQEMGASTFRSMLHYMYHGSLPNVDKADISSTIAEYQHLLAAADRYGLERLKKICEDKLCGNFITFDNVVSMLELAEGHICPRLKARCLDFLSDGENFMMVATTDAYVHLMQTFPSLLVEVRNKFKMARGKPTITETGAHKIT